MKAHSYLVSLFTSLALAGSVALAGAETKPADAAAQPEPAKALKNPEGWPVLKKGATAEEIVKLIGKPDAVRPMETKEGKAEIWVYRRLAKTVTRQSAVTTQSAQTYGIDGTATIAVPVFRTETISVYQVSSLLMFDGKLVTATQKAETERHFES